MAAQRMGNGSTFITTFLGGENEVHCGGSQNSSIRCRIIAEDFFAKEECQICICKGLIISGGPSVFAQA